MDKCSSRWQSALHRLFCFADVEECTLNTHQCTCNGLPGCTATCADIDGSYTCGCNSLGYLIDTDGLTCIGEWLETIKLNSLCPCNSSERNTGSPTLLYEPFSVTDTHLTDLRTGDRCHNQGVTLKSFISLMRDNSLFVTTLTWHKNGHI